MKCPKCDTFMTAGINKNEEQCANVLGCGYEEEHYVIACDWQARAEKAESELKAIKDRIEAVTDDEILEIIEEQDEKYMNCLTADEYIAKAVIEKIKQIGGEK